ncbi:MAG: M20/M25/M40 family metallo-hydrolase [Anaerofustis sp.]
MIFLYVVLGILVSLIAVVLIRTFSYKNELTPHSDKPMPIDREMEDAIRNMAKAVTFRTVSQPPEQPQDFAEFEKFRAFLKEAFPLVHEKFSLELINGQSMIYTLKGSDEGLLPILFLGHCDVVPVDETTLSQWEKPPFSGEIANGNLYGRGTLDDKNMLITIMQAAENLLKEGFSPKRGITFAFGHDEELGGADGALKMAKHFESQGLRFEAVYDEGGIAITDAIKGVKSPLALIGVAEKGFNNFKITVNAAGGHSSMPPKHSALGQIAKIAVNIENKPMKATLTPIVIDLLKNICDEMGFAVKMAVANLWLFKPLLIKVLAAGDTTAAMIRTTTALTMAKGSDAPNVLPQTAELVVNARVLPGNTPDDVKAHLQAACKDVKATVSPMLLEQPSPVSELDSKGYRKLIEVIGEVYPNTIPTPYLVLGGTDARKYYNVSNCVYRFMPALITDEQKGTMHAANEHISTDNIKRMVVFFEKMMSGFDE